MSRALDILKTVDRWLGPPLARCVSGAPRPVPSEIRDVLFVRLWGLGNLTLLAPILEAAGDRRLRLLTLRRNEAFVRAQFPRVELLTLRAPPHLAAPFSLAQALCALRRDPPDVVVDLEQFLRLPGVAVRAACPAPVVGLDTPGQDRRALLDRPVAHDAVRHMGETFAAIAAAAGLPAPRGPGRLRVDPARRRDLHRRLRPSGGPLVVVHPGSGAHAPGRRWSAERYGRLAQALIDEHGAEILVTGVASERTLASDVVRHAGAAPRNLCGRLEIPDLLALLDLADLLVTNDTGPVHMADALGTPTVALFGPNTPLRYGPRRPGSIALFADLPCSPCLDDRTMKRSGCRHFACMAALEVDHVAVACRQALMATTRRESRHAAAH